MYTHMCEHMSMFPDAALNSLYSFMYPLIEMYLRLSLSLSQSLSLPLSPIQVWVSTGNLHFLSSRTAWAAS